MKSLQRYFPSGCSRLKIFICYAFEDRGIAEEIAQSLRSDGHDVFIDIVNLKGSDDYNQRIREYIRSADRFLFLISKSSISAGAYTLTELGFAKDRWPSPEGRVWPFLIDDSVKISELPVYLRAVHIQSIKGSAPAEIAAEIDATKGVGAFCLGFSAFAAFMTVFLAWLAATGGFDKFSTPQFAMIAPVQADFRPSKRPASDTDWKKSKLVVTILPVQYKNHGSRSIRILNEKLNLKLGKLKLEYQWGNEVDLRANGCGADWLCTKNALGVQTLEPESSLSREIMYLPVGSAGISWSKFLEHVFTEEDSTLSLRVTSNTESSGVFSSRAATATLECLIDISALKVGLSEQGYDPASDRIPYRLTPTCSQKVL